MNLKIFSSFSSFIFCLATLTQTQAFRTTFKTGFFGSKNCPTGYWNFRIGKCMAYPENHPSHYTTKILGYDSTSKTQNKLQNGKVDPCRGWFAKIWNRGCSVYPANHPSHYGKEILGQDTSKPWSSKPFYGQTRPGNVGNNGAASGNYRRSGYTQRNEPSRTGFLG